MVFHVKIAYNMETVKIAKPTNFFYWKYEVRLRPRLIQKRLIITFKFTSKYISITFIVKVD